MPGKAQQQRHDCCMAMMCMYEYIILNLPVYLTLLLSLICKHDYIVNKKSGQEVPPGRPQ